MKLLSDTDFLSQFEEHTLAPVEFSHRGHMRLAWLYLRSHDLEQAIVKVATGSEAEMTQWHVEFERLMPGAHQDFLESLSIPAAEIRAIRQRSSG